MIIMVEIVFGPVVCVCLLSVCRTHDGHRTIVMERRAQVGPWDKSNIANITYGSHYEN